MNLYNTHSDTERAVADMKGLRDALPILPPNPSIWKVDLRDKIVQITYGSPDQHHAMVNVFSSDPTTREKFDTFKAATDRFLELVGESLS